MDYPFPQRYNIGSNVPSRMVINKNPFVPDTEAAQNDRFWVNEGNLPPKHAQRSGCEANAQRELAGLREDVAYLRRRNYDAQRPWKFITYQYRPYSSAVVPTAVPGQYYWDGDGENLHNIRDSNDLRISGTLNTNPRLIQTLDSFRPNWPRIRGYYDAPVESALIQSEMSPVSKNCKPVEVAMPDRGLVWQYFDHLCYNPQNPKHVVNQHWMRGGVSTRNDLRQHFLSRPYCAGAKVKYD